MSFFGLYGPFWRSPQCTVEPTVSGISQTLANVLSAKILRCCLCSCSSHLNAIAGSAPAAARIGIRPIIAGRVISDTAREYVRKTPHEAAHQMAGQRGELCSDVPEHATDYRADQLSYSANYSCDLADKRLPRCA